MDTVFKIESFHSRYWRMPYLMQVMRDYSLIRAREEGRPFCRLSDAQVPDLYSHL